MSYHVKKYVTHPTPEELERLLNEEEKEGYRLDYIFDDRSYVTVVTYKHD